VVNDVRSRNRKTDEQAKLHHHQDDREGDSGECDSKARLIVKQIAMRQPGHLVSELRSVSFSNNPRSTKEPAGMNSSYRYDVSM
jgi:hypothetical protein